MCLIRSSPRISKNGLKRFFFVLSSEERGGPISQSTEDSDFWIGLRFHDISAWSCFFEILGIGEFEEKRFIGWKMRYGGLVQLLQSDFIKFDT